MMADIAKLKRPGKGTPPSMTEAPGNTGRAAREKEEEQRPLQFRVPASVFESFSREAGETFGFKKGAKSELFLRIWEAYKRNKT
jgi:hypothetical protein